MRTKTLQVRLDTTATPPVTVVQDTQPVGRHHYQLNWVPDTGQSGWVFADTIAHDRPHPLNAAFSLERFAAGKTIDEKGVGPVPGAH